MFRAALMRCKRYATAQALAARRRLGATHAFYHAEFVLTRHDVWITIQIINASSRSPDSPVPPYANDGPRDEDLRHRPSSDADAGGDLRVTGHGPGIH
jgi:hypothetical protein